MKIITRHMLYNELLQIRKQQTLTLRRLASMSAALDALMTEVTNAVAVMNSAAEKIKGMTDDSAQLTALQTQLKTAADALSAAVTPPPAG